jgi:hypothetical protein
MKRYRVRQTVWGAICAYCGRGRVMTFGGVWDATQWIERKRAEGHVVEVSGLY